MLYPVWELLLSIQHFITITGKPQGRNLLHCIIRQTYCISTPIHCILRQMHCIYDKYITFMTNAFYFKINWQMHYILRQMHFIFRFLIRAGADATRTDYLGNTPLSLALSYNNLEMANIIIAAGAPCHIAQQHR